MNLPLLFCIIYASIIFYLSSQTGQELPELPAPDYVAHFIEYFGFGVLLFWWRSRAGALAQMRSKAFWQALLLGSFYGATDEFHQYFVPGRWSSWHDWFADTLGVAAGALAAILFIKIWLPLKIRIFVKGQGARKK